MNAKNFIAAAAVLIATGSAFAAEAPEAGASAGTAVAGTAVATATASNATLAAARVEAKEDTADIVKHYRTPLAIQLDQYRN